MKRIIFFASILLATACTSLKDEFTPVFTTKYAAPEAARDTVMTANVTVAELSRMYTPGNPLDMRRNLILKGVVTTSDRSGNFYKTLYVQDSTGGIEVKIGRNGLYNDYPLGQELYICLKGLTIGMYGHNNSGYGMLGIGFADPSGEYETSYLENPLMIDKHIYKGAGGVRPVEPVVITSEVELPYKNSTQRTNHNLGKYVTLKGLKYDNEVFTLLYLDSRKDKKSYTNRVFISPSNVSSDPTAGITSWALSKEKMTEMLTSGRWDAFRVGSGNNYTGEKLGDFKGDGSYPGVEKVSATISHYFKMGNTRIQIRTSGYSKFADTEIDPEVLAGRASIDVTGILTLYQGSLQFYVNELEDIKIII